MPSTAISGVSYETIYRIADAYGLNTVELLPVAKGYRNESHPLKLDDGTYVNVILFKTGPDVITTINNADRVSKYLYDCGLPSRRRVDHRLVQLRWGDKNKYAGLYNYLSGATLPWDAYTMKHLKLLGRTMSDMHTLLSNCNAKNLPDISAVYESILHGMKQYYDQPGVQAALADKLGVKSPDLTDCFMTINASKYLSSQQVLHMDFVRGNILFDTRNGELAISGILDFEKTAYGHPVFDIARTLAFLLVDCKYKTSEKVYKYFLKSGYIKHGSAVYHNVSIKHNAISKSLMGELIDMFLLYDFYKFLAHNPYENLKQNEHFVRTRNLLIEKGQLITC